jgi:hypothetical protein
VCGWSLSCGRITPLSRRLGYFVWWPVTDFSMVQYFSALTVVQEVYQQHTWVPDNGDHHFDSRWCHLKLLPVHGWWLTGHPYLITTKHWIQTVFSMYCLTLQETETGHHFYWFVVTDRGIILALTVQYCDLSTVLYVKTRPGTIYSKFTGLSILVSFLMPAVLTSVTEVFSFLCQMQMWSTIWQICCLDIISLSHTHKLSVSAANNPPPPHTHTHTHTHRM